MTVSSIKIRTITNPEKWSDSLGNFKHSIYITVWWLDSVSIKGENPLYIDFLANDEIVGKLSGLKVNKRKRLPSMLYFYSGIAFKTQDEALIRSCYDHLLIFAKREKMDKVVIRSYGYYESFTFSLKKFYIDRVRTEYLSDLTPGENIIFSRLHATTKRHVKKAKRYGSTIFESTSKDILNLLYKFLDTTFNIRVSKGYSPYNIFYHRNFRKKSLQLFLNKGLATMFYVQTNNEINSIVYILLHKQKASLFLVGTTEKGYKVYSPAFLEYEIMILLKRKGFTLLNFGGIPFHSSHRGLVQFKKSLGTYKVTLLDQKTYFLQFPLNMLNPIFYTIDHVPVNLISKYIIKVLRRLTKIYILDDG